MALYADGLINWGGNAGEPVYVKQADGSWANVGAPEHAESASYVMNAVNDPQVAKVIALNNAAPQMLNNEQRAFIAAGMGGLDSFGQGYRWGAQNLFDNVFDPQQAGYLLSSGFANYLSDADKQAGSQFNYEQSPAQQAARSGDGGLFGGGLGQLAALAAIIYSGGSAAGLWGATEGALGGGFIDAIGSGIGAGESITGALGAAGAGGAGMTGAGGSGAMDWSNLGDLWDYGTPNSPTDFTQLIGPGGDVNAAIDALQTAVQNGSMTTEQAMQAMQQVNNAASGSEWTNFLNTGALGDPSTALSMMQRLESLGLSPTQALQAAKSALSGGGSSGLLSGLGIGANALGSYLANTAGKDAATKAAAAQIQAAQIAADAAKFKPIGITTRFGESNFIKDAQGNVVGAGYNLAPDMKAQQDKMIGASGTALDQYMAAPGMFAPMGAAGQRAMSLGNQYLATDPQAQALKYMQDQQALLATGRERDMNQMLSGEFNRGTYGLATGGTSTGMGAANPRLEAMLNAQRQQDLGLAAQATQGGMDYAKFGAALTGTGGDLVRGMFSGQTAAYDPYKTAIGGAQYLEGLGQQPLTMGIDIGKQTSNAAAGGLLAQGITNAAGIQQQAAGSPWANALGMLGGGLQNYQQQQQQQQMMNKIWGV